MLFVAVFSVEGALRPGYEVRSTFISALALGPRGPIQIMNFVVLGLMVLLFAAGVRAGFREGKASKAGWVLFAIIGVAFVGSGLFVMDPMWAPREAMTTHGLVHQLLGALVFSLGPASCFVFWRRFRIDAPWQSFAPWTLGAGVLSVAAVLFLRVATRMPEVLGGWVGVPQRVALITVLAWMAAFATLLRRNQ